MKKIIFKLLDNELIPSLIEEWTLIPEKRHGKLGYSANRVTKNSSNHVFIKDEHYMFFASLDGAYLAFLNSHLEEGRLAY